MGGGTLSYGIYQISDADLNYFAGHTGMGIAGQADSQLRVDADYTGAIAATRYGIQASLGYDSTGTTLTGARVIETSVDVDSGDTITSAFGLYCASPSGTGTIGSCYGVYIADQETGPTTTGYGIYQVGATMQNYFASVVGTKNTTPSNTYGLDDGGGVNTSDAYYVDGTQVVSNRVTGWGTVSGTTSRAAFDTATITLVQLAQHFGQLLLDLETHGLISNP
jgi:hypothetical protein